MTRTLIFPFEDPITPGGLVADYSGFLHHLTVTGGVSASGKWPGPAGRGAMNCTAGGGIVKENPIGFTGTGFGICWWMKLTPGGPTDQVAFHLGTKGSSDTTTGIVFWAADVLGRLAFRRGTEVITTTTDLRDGNWHFVSVQAGSNLASGATVITVDGASNIVGTGAVPTALTNPDKTANYLSIGQDLAGGRTVHGLIDDLSGGDPNDSTSLGYSQAVIMGSPLTSRLWGQWSFEEQAGAVGYDTSGFGRDMTLTAPVTWTGGSGIHLGGSRTAGSPLGTATLGSNSERRWLIGFWLRRGTINVTTDPKTILEVRTSSGDLRFEALLSADDTQVIFTSYATGGVVDTSYTFTIPDTDWHHYALSHSVGVQRTWFLDGTGAIANGGAFATADWNVLNIGAGHYAGPVDADLDDVRLINNYLFDTDVRRQMAVSSAVPLVAVNKMNLGATPLDATAWGANPVKAVYLGREIVFGTPMLNELVRTPIPAKESTGSTTLSYTSTQNGTYAGAPTQGTTTSTFDPPKATLDGDTLFLLVGTRNNGSITLPDGWSWALAPTAGNGGGVGTYGIAYHYVQDSFDLPAAWTIGFPGETDTRKPMLCWRMVGVDPDNPIISAQSWSMSSSSPLALPAVTAPDHGLVLLATFSYLSWTTSDPTGLPVEYKKPKTGPFTAGYGNVWHARPAAPAATLSTTLGGLGVAQIVIRPRTHGG